MQHIIGHENTKELINIAVKSSQRRNKALPHMLFSGLAGCGKTTMAVAIADICNADFLPVSPDDMKDSRAVLDVLDKLDHSGYDSHGNRTDKIKPTVVFFDEIHKMPRKGQEVFGIAMEKFLLETNQANKYYWLPYFTVIGATTDDGELTKPFREKFKLRFLFEAYSFDEICAIVDLHAAKKDVLITPKAVREIAQRSRGIPRAAVMHLDRIRDYMLATGAVMITSGLAKDNFKMAGIDALGLTKPEITLLKTLYVNSDPVGLDNLAIITNESAKNIKNTIEPYLIQRGLMIRSGKGRVITKVGREHLENDGYTGAKRKKVEIPANYERK